MGHDCTEMRARSDCDLMEQERFNLQLENQKPYLQTNRYIGNMSSWIYDQPLNMILNYQMEQPC